MSGMWGWRKLPQMSLSHCQMHYNNNNCLGWHRSLAGILGIQDRFKWDGGGGGGGGGDNHNHNHNENMDDGIQKSRSRSRSSSNSHSPPLRRKIKAETNCPRCSSNRFNLNLPAHAQSDEDNKNNNNTNSSNNSSSTSAPLNFCPTCKTAYHFRISPLQGTFVEIGRPHTHKSNSKTTPRNGLRVSFWDNLRSENLPPSPLPTPPPPPSSPGNGIAVHTPPPPSSPGDFEKRVNLHQLVHRAVMLTILPTAIKITG